MTRDDGPRTGNFSQHHMKRLLATVALGAWLAPVAGAQATPDLIPKDVVLAILRAGGSQVMGQGEPAIFVGDRLPDNLVNKVSLPPGAHVMATLESWSSTDVIGTATASPDSIRAWFTAEFVRRKYEAQDYPNHRLPFRPADGNVNTGFCGAGTFFTVSSLGSRPGRTDWVLHARQRPTCEQPQVAFVGTVMGGASTSGYNAPSLPLLVNPKTSEVSQQRCDTRYVPGMSSTQTALSTTATPEQLMTHYGKQLDSAGWKREAISTGVVGTWIRRDSTGRDVRVQLTAMPGSGGADCRMLTMTTTGVQP